QVFSSVTSVLNMSVFKEQFVVEDLLQEIKRRSRALSFGPLQANGHVSVRGSFPEIKLLGDFLLLKAKCLSEEDRRGESQSHQRPRRRLQQEQLNGELSRSVRGADGESQMVVLDTDVYCYMKAFSPWRLQGSADVVISATTDGDTTTLYLESAEPKSAVGQISRIREQIEEHSIELYGALRKERLSFKGHTRAEKERYQRLCAHLEPHFPHLMMIHYDTHIDVVGSPPDIVQFTKVVSN
ncbi:RBM43 protein, partial [Psilopogon haemacephalus]|nr:RBM43 protein [Psilopogon haemacephalus]